MQLTKTEIQCLRDIKADKIYASCWHPSADRLEAAGLIKIVDMIYQLTEEGERLIETN